MSDTLCRRAVTGFILCMGGRWTLRNTCISSIDQYFILKVKED